MYGYHECFHFSLAPPVTELNIEPPRLSQALYLQIYLLFSELLMPDQDNCGADLSCWQDNVIS